MRPPNPEAIVERLLSQQITRRDLLRGVGAAAVGGPATLGVVSEQLMQLDALATQLFIERENIPPSVTYYSDPSEALGFYVSFSGTGLPVADYMGRMIAPDVSNYQLVSMAANDGSHIRIPELTSEIVNRARQLRPDMQKVRFVFHGLSFGGIEQQLVANHIAQYYSDVAEVVGSICESTPSGLVAVKKLLGQFLVATAQPVGKGMIYASNAWGIIGEQGRRDDDVWYDIAKCSGDTFASVIPDQAALIRAGYPAIVTPKIPPTHPQRRWYIGSFDDSDEYVNTARSFDDINRIVGGNLHRADLLEAGHAGGWTAKGYGNYFTHGYAHALDDFASAFR